MSKCNSDKSIGRREYIINWIREIIGSSMVLETYPNIGVYGECIHLMNTYLK